MYYIFDKDGTLTRSKSGKPFAVNVEDQELIPGVEETLTELRENEPSVVFLIASNQGGVAFGTQTMAMADALVQDAVRKIGASLGMFCPEHPEGTVEPFNVSSDDRKPWPGMILKLMEAVGALPEDVVVVGDKPEDEQAAKAADVKFIHSDEFFGRVVSVGA
jgi:D-glycero-D-manno-heptose 1,7-bisphosphate phosphatase